MAATDIVMSVTSIDTASPSMENAEKEARAHELREKIRALEAELAVLENRSGRSKSPSLAPMSSTESDALTKVLLRMDDRNTAITGEKRQHSMLHITSALAAAADVLDVTAEMDHPTGFRKDISEGHGEATINEVDDLVEGQAIRDPSPKLDERKREVVEVIVPATEASKKHQSVKHLCSVFARAGAGYDNVRQPSPEPASEYDRVEPYVGTVYDEAAIGKMFPATLGPKRPGNDWDGDASLGAPIPTNEDFRLAVLRSLNLFGSPREHRFDRLTAMAAMIWKAPIAILALIDETEVWCKSVFGAEPFFAERKTSFCAFNMLPDDDPFLLVEDALTDNRFKENPYVLANPGIRFYAGAPLVTSGGFILGAICICDYRPRRNFNRQDMSLLVGLSELVSKEIERDTAALELQKISAQRFNEDKKGLLQAIDAFSEGLVMCDVSSRRQPVVFVNEGYEAITGYSMQELVGCHIGSLLQGPSTEGSTVQVLREAIRKNEPAQVEIINYKKDGTPFWNFLRIKPVTPKDSTDTRRYYFGTVSDITAQKEREFELQRRRLAEIEAEYALKAKRSFVASISHEIRTPMHAIIAASQLLGEAPSLTQEQVDLANTIHGSGQQLLCLINDILDFSKLEAGKMGLCLAEHNLWACIDFCIEMVSVKCQAKRLNLTYTVDPDVPRYLWVDEVRLRQILINLLSNASKFTEDGGDIELRVTSRRPLNSLRTTSGGWTTRQNSVQARLGSPRTVDAAAAHWEALHGVASAGVAHDSTPQAPPADRSSRLSNPPLANGAPEEATAEEGWNYEKLTKYDLQFFVRDTGIGMPASFQQSLFQPFMQCDNSRTRKFEGSGLGLKISKELCEAMGGRMWAESVDGEGSTFFFTIQAHGSYTAHGCSTKSAPEGQLAGKRALLVSSPSFLSSATSVLSALGLTVIPATSLAELNQACSAAQRPSPPPLDISSLPPSGTTTPASANLTPVGSKRRRETYPVEGSTSSVNDSPRSAKVLLARTASGQASPLPVDSGKSTPRLGVDSFSRRTGNASRSSSPCGSRGRAGGVLFDVVVVDWPHVKEGSVKVQGGSDAVSELAWQGLRLRWAIPTVVLAVPRSADCVQPMEGVTVVAKPLRSNQLVATLTRLLLPEGSEGARLLMVKPAGDAKKAVEWETDTHKAQLRILVVEDNAVNRVVLGKLLHNLNYRDCTFAASGYKALEQLAARDFDVVLMDLQMPGIDGLQTTRRLRLEVVESAQPLVVALTADVGCDVENECRQAGMNGYLSKPVSKEGLSAVLGSCLRLKAFPEERSKIKWLRSVL